MDINNIQLSSLAVGEWYKDVLLTSPDASPAIEGPAQPPIPASRPIPPSAPAPPPPSPAQITPPTAKTPDPAKPAPYKFLGNNRRNVAIVVHSPGTPFLPDNQLSFLTKILEACRMNIGDIAIVNAATTPVAIAELRQQLNPTAVLLFGLEPVAIKLPINFPVFRLQPYDACTYLSAPALSQLVQNSEESKLLKSKLWVCLKTLFNV
jgi:hypothetical protein